MSGRSRGRKSSRAKGRGKGRAKAAARAAPDDAPREPGPPQSPGLGQEAGESAPAAPARAGAGGGGLETAVPAPSPGPVQRRDASAAACRLPLDCGLALRAGASVLATPRSGPATATSFIERLAADHVFVGTVGAVVKPKSNPRAGNRRVPAGKKVPVAGPAGGSVSRVLRAEAGERPKTEPAAAPASVKEEEKAVGTEGSGPQGAEGSMDTLETVQLKLETMNAQADRAYLRLSRKFGQLRLRHLERRNLLIQNIPGFWGQAFQNHPQLSSFLNNQDKEVLSYLNSLEVEELGLARLGYKIKFYFGRNPYFQNRVLIKEYGCGPSGQVISRSTPVQWLPGHSLHSLSQGNPENNRSFFGWFSNHSPIESDKIVEIINEELWPNPLQYYLMSEEAHGEKGQEGRPGPAKKPGKTPEPAARQSN
ncbi:testis-specific Y-encoded-like protein 5 [Ctenodactylus gundi]